MPIEIRRKDVKALVEGGRAQLVDVLSPSEYAKQHLPRALNVPLQNLNAATTRHFDKEAAIIVYSSNCQCDRSARAASRLEILGFHQVYRYTAGKTDWLAAGWPTEGTEAAPGGLRNLVRKNVPTCFLRERLGEVKNRRQPDDDLCVVINDRNIVLGVIQGDAWNANPAARVVDVMDCGPLTLRPNLDPKEARELLKDYDASSVIVTTSDGELLGTVRIAKHKPKTDEAA